jgi:uncharacterized protein involved in cysteine biosynthesis
VAAVVSFFTALPIVNLFIIIIFVYQMRLTERKAEIENAKNNQYIAIVQQYYSQLIG